MSSSQLFRMSQYGYNKKDVNNYIIAINNELSATAARLNRVSDELFAEQRKNADELARLNAMLNAAESKLSTLSSVEQENQQLKERISLLQAEKEEAEKSAPKLITVCMKTCVQRQERFWLLPAQQPTVY